MQWRSGIKKISSKKYKTKGKYNVSSQEYKNPYFKTNKRKAKIIRFNLTWKFKLILLAFLFLSASALIWAMYSGFFEIDRIIVNGEGKIPKSSIEKIARSQIEENMFILWPRKNILLFNKDKLIAELEKKYAFNRLSVEKKLPDTLELNYQEKEYALIWREDEDYYYADEEGYIISKANILEVEQKDYPLISNSSGQNIKDIQISVDAAYLKFAIRLFRAFNHQDGEFIIERFEIGGNDNKIKVILRQGPELYFNINADMEKQLNKLLVLKKEKLQNDFEHKTYIDLSFGDRVYYR